MPVYAIAIIPLLEIIKPETQVDITMKHVVCVNCQNFDAEWDNIVSCGPKLGYNPNASKSWLVVKPQAEEKAREIFGGISINITTERRNYLGGYIGSESGCRKWLARRATN